MKIKTIFKIASVILCLFLVFRLLNPTITKSMTVLRCEGKYKMSVFGRPYEGYNYHNAKMDIAKCLCKKYIATKDKKHATEIGKILSEFEAYDNIKDEPVEEICENRDSVFIYWYYE
ncbi:hypothetical protein [Niabella hibiscisoli]|uniref:hypothetical protein n=1 Tax=Niabella hibiscisoli TaxID=1825928 RepID=UPI001F1186AD|nr:hypothetical protein [Niabella hibiscisoli]MCH5715525.1 hypothetical protein [Niabella hibiscisoli]